MRRPGRAVFVVANLAITAFLVTPLLIVVAFSVNSSNFLQFPLQGFSLRWFTKFLQSPVFTNALWLSLGVAAIVVVVSVALGVPAALALARGRLHGARLLSAFFLAPLMLPAILTGFALFQALLALGLGRPVWGLVVGHVVVAVPYVIRTTLAVLADSDRRVEEATAVFGASPRQVLFEVTLPTIRPGVAAGAVFAFITSFDQLPVSLFLVAPGGETLPVVMFNYIKFDLDGTLAAASVVSIVMAVLVVLVVERTVGLQSLLKI